MDKYSTSNQQATRVVYRDDVLPPGLQRPLREDLDANTPLQQTKAMVSMQLRRLACTLVLVACAMPIVVFASPAPVDHTNDGDIEHASNVQVRDWNVADMTPRYSGEDVVTSNVAVLEARDKKRPISKSKAKPPVPKQANGSRPKGTAQKGGAAQCSFTANGKAKRAFSPSCDTASLTLGGVTRSITKVANQGNSAITYKVDDGWPDPTDGKIVTAYAKTGSSVSFADEAHWLGKTDQLLAEGTVDGHNFIVFHGVTDKKHLAGTKYFVDHLAPVMMGQPNFSKCEALMKQKLNLVVQEVKTYVIKYGILHTDVQPGNILWDEAANDPTLIDWGRAKDVGVGHYDRAN
ncbi:hypothetical protein EYR36_002286 [Pleurotus pulmonarius]|nr:hypothetical protein EYR36_002286 [Pleurotus pulmonarius]